jgi:tetratricopeptide (TPR) repeat protein
MQLQATTPAQEEEAPALTESQLVEVAGALDQRGDVVRAEQYWTLALAQGAHTKLVLPKLMAAFVRDRQYRLALQYASEHLRRHPNDDKLRLLSGTIYEAVGDYPSAVRQYQAVLQQLPLRADVHYLLAEVLLRGGAERAQADLHYRKYLELDPQGLYAERAQASLLKEVSP